MKVTNEQLKKIRAIVYDAYCEGDTDAEALLPFLDAALVAPEQEPVAWGMQRSDGLLLDIITPEEHEAHEGKYTVPLYRHPSPQSQPVARVTGYYAGRCVIEPLDGKSVFPAGMAMYSAPPATQSAQEPIACKHNRYSVDVHEQTGNCLDCGAEGRMRFVVDDTAPPNHYDQTALEMCEVCGWKTLIPGDCCLNCERAMTSDKTQNAHDAARYRFLKTRDYVEVASVIWREPEQWDAAIDAMQGENNGPR